MTTPRKVQTTPDKIVAWYAVGRHGHGPRTADPVRPVAEVVASIKRMGVSRAFLPDPAGATERAEGQPGGGYYRFLERIVSALNPAWRHYADWADQLVKGLIAEGITPVWYMGCPREPHEMGFLEQVLGSLPAGCEVAFDGAAAMGKGSCCEQAIEQYGRKNFYIEALPWKGMEHWRGMRVVMLGGTRLDCEDDRVAHRGKTTGPMDDADFAEVIVAMTGHTKRDEITKPADRDAQRWLRQGHTLAIQPSAWDRYARDVVEVIR